MRRIKIAPGAPAAAAAVPTLSIESMSIEQLLVGRTVLSVEEEVIVLGEADQLQNQVDQDVAETARVEDVTDVMLNVADTVEDAKEVTPAQAELINTVSEMAVAGSDGDPDDVIPEVSAIPAEPVADPSATDPAANPPATPSDNPAANPETVADPEKQGEEPALTVEAFVEDLRKRASEIWERIRKFCIEIWKGIVEFFKRIFMVAPRLLHRIAQLRAIVAEKKKTVKDIHPKEQQIALLVGSNAVSYPDYTVHDTKELVKGLGELKGLATYAFGTYVKDCVAMGTQVAAELKKYDPKKAGETLHTVAIGLQKHNFTNLPGNPATGYLGCFEVVAQRLDKNKTKDLSDAQIVGALRNSSVTLQTRTGRAAPLNTRNGFATMTFSEMDSVLSAVEGLVKQVVAYENSSEAKAIDKVRAELIEAGNTASGVVGKMVGNDEAGKVERMYAMDVMKSLMNFNTSLTRWVSSLTMPVSKKVYQSARAALVLVEKSATQYA